MDRLHCAICNRKMLTGERTKVYSMGGMKSGVGKIFVEATVGPECLDKAVPEVYRLLTRELEDAVYTFKNEETN